jgi:DNA-binding NtrC family response regulator
MLQRVLHVLLVVAEDRLNELRGLLSNDSLRLSAISSVAEAAASAREDAPDVVLADVDPPRLGGEEGVAPLGCPTRHTITTSTTGYLRLRCWYGSRTVGAANGSACSASGSA